MPKMVVQSDHCKGCGLCVDACPSQCIEIDNKVLNMLGYHPAKYKGSGCTGCAICFYACPEPDAIIVYKKDMSPEEVLNINGNFKKSPLLEVIKKLHKAFSEKNVPYAVVGGLAVIRNGGFRTTHDIDILTTEAGWAEVRKGLEGEFKTGTDFAEDNKLGIPVDVYSTKLSSNCKLLKRWLFPGEEWDMVIPLPEPDKVWEFDEKLGACFISLKKLIELKTAVYLVKLKEDGPELAAKDMADVVMLIENNLDNLIPGDFEGYHQEIKAVLLKVHGKLARRKK